MHAQNELLPLRVVVQVLFFGQARVAMAGGQVTELPNNIKALLATHDDPSKPSTHTTVPAEDQWSVSRLKSPKSKLSTLKIKLAEDNDLDENFKDGIGKSSKVKAICALPTRLKGMFTRSDLEPSSDSWNLDLMAGNIEACLLLKYCFFFLYGISRPFLYLDPMAQTSKIPTLSPTIVSSAAHLIIAKLTFENYLLWKAQILPFLKGNKVYGFIDGSLPSPPSTIADQPNPEYEHWILQDQLLISAINSSLTDTVLAQLLDCSTSQDVWTTLQGLFSAKTQAHIMHTQYSLATLKKGSETITEYFHKAKVLSASLNAAGHPLSPHEFNIYLLAGLGSDYDSIVTSITTRPEPLTSAQIYNYLLNHESRLNHQTQSLLFGSSVSAHTTTVRSSPNRGRSRGHGHGRGGGRPYSSSPNSFTSNSSNRPTCQLCQRVGHIVVSCYYIFDHTFQAPPPPSFSANYLALPSNHSPAHPNSWFPDTAATNHFTVDFSNLNLDSSSCQGTDCVSIRDGSFVPIQHSGNSILQIPTGKFLLRQLFHGALFVCGCVIFDVDCPLNLVLKYEMTKNCWTVMKKMITARSFFASGVIEGMIYVAGGNNTDLFELNSAEVLDPDKGIWQPIANMGTRMASYDAAVLNRKLLITEGWFWPFYFVPRGQIYDPKTDNWEGMAAGLREGWIGSSVVVYGPRKLQDI
ncbi:hypothetical protein F0562_006447 [Nyssa sinensis]|uniref:NPH3 domain-containing protein n=1 Tax=Nyssa sinensis TaxID=561372 RepID=A0A5J5APX2_9ASTE|nr:hypothetical protein F0562_006447 [Nyssa sinensis]